MARILTPTALAPYVAIEEETARTRVFLLYGDPEEPGWARAWLRSGSSATRDAVAPAAPVPADLDVRPALDPRRRQLPQRRVPHLQPLAHAPLRLPDQPTRDVHRLPPGRDPRPPRLGPHTELLRLPRPGQHRLALPGPHRRLDPHAPRRPQRRRPRPPEPVRQQRDARLRLDVHGQQRADRGDRPALRQRLALVDAGAARPLRRRERRRARDRPLDRPRPRQLEPLPDDVPPAVRGLHVRAHAGPRRRPRAAKARTPSAGRRSRSRRCRGRRRPGAAGRRPPGRRPSPARSAAGRSGHPPRPRTAACRG